MVNLAEINAFIIKHAHAKYFADDVKLYKKHFPQSRLIPELEKAPDFVKKQLDERILTELLQNQDSCIDCIWENRGFIREKNGALIPISDLKKSGLTEEEINTIAEKATALIETIAGSSNLEGVKEIEKQVLELITPLPEGAKNPIDYKLKEVVKEATDKFEVAAQLEQLKINEAILLNSDIDKMEYNDTKKLIYDLSLRKLCADDKGDTYKAVLTKYKENLLCNSKNNVENGGGTENEETESDATGEVESSEDITEVVPSGADVPGNAQPAGETVPGNAQAAEELESKKKEEDQGSNTPE